MRRLFLFFGLILLTLSCQAQCFTEVSGGIGTVLGKKADGTIWGWGDNTVGQLGGLPLPNYFSAANVPNTNNVAKLFCGAFATFVIKNDGTLWATGGNFNGNLGINSTAQTIAVLTQVGLANNWKEVSGEYFTVGTKTDGTLWAWGQNGGHQMGDGSYCADRLAPGQVGTDSDWNTVVATGARSAFAIKSNGTLWGWGTNIAGLLGSNVVQSISVPTQFTSDSNWEKLAPGWDHILALRLTARFGLGAMGNTGPPVMVCLHHICDLRHTRFCLVEHGWIFPRV